MKSTFDYLFSIEENGAEINMGANTDGTEIFFTLREAGCKEHEQSMRRYQKLLAASRKNPTREHEILARVVAEAIIVDWRGVKDVDGNDVPCTFENKLEALTKYKKLYYEVIAQASNEENFRYVDFENDIEEDSEKNSKTS